MTSATSELIESRLSRFGEAPLLLIAEQAKANLLEQDRLASGSGAATAPAC